MDQITQIKQALDIATVVGSYVQLNKSGKNYKGLCPFHSENSPSFMVSPELQIYKCFGCGEAGDIFSFIQKVEGVDFPTALEQLAQQAGIKLEKEKFDPDAKLKKEILWLNEQAARFYNYLLNNHPSGAPGLLYFKEKRGLSDKTISDFMLGYAPEAYDTLYKFFTQKKVDADLMVKAGLIIKSDRGGFLDKFRGRVVFPLMGIDGKVLGFAGRTIFDKQPKYLNTSDTPVFHKSFFIYGLDKAKIKIKKEGAVFVEGNMDVISAHSAGISNVVAASGTSITTGQLKLISRYTQDLIFCFDSDPAGINASFRGIEMAESLGFNIKVAVLPAGKKDIDEVIKDSKEKALEIFEKSVPAYDFLLYSLIKKHNKNSPDGKKKIMDEIAPLFARIKNKVLIDHYTKVISHELGLNVETVTEAFSSGNFTVSTPVAEASGSSLKQMLQQSPESYIITLALKGGLDFMRSKLYKVEPIDFSNGQLATLLTELIADIKEGSKKTFDPNKFKKDLSEELVAAFEDLYLHPLNEELLSNDSHLEKEFDSVLFRLKAASAKRRMHTISDDLKHAEKSNNTEEVQKLTAEFEKLKTLLMEP